MRCLVGSAPESVLLGCLDTCAGSALGKLRDGVLVQTHRRLPWEGSYLTGPPRRDVGHRGNAVIRIAWPLPWLLSPGRSGGNDHGSFRSQFGVQAFEKPVGTAGFEPATP